MDIILSTLDETSDIILNWKTAFQLMNKLKTVYERNDTSENETDILFKMKNEKPNENEINIYLNKMKMFSDKLIEIKSTISEKKNYYLMKYLQSISTLTIMLKNVLNSMMLLINS